MDSIIQRFNELGVRYLLIGGQAIRLAGAARFSLDWDFFIPPDDKENLDRINGPDGIGLCESLLPPGENGENSIQVFQLSNDVIQFHFVVPGLASFEIAESAAVERRTERGTPVRTASNRYLLSAKLAADRQEDQADIQFLSDTEGRDARQE